MNHFKSAFICEFSVAVLIAGLYQTTIEVFVFFEYVVIDNFNNEIESINSNFNEKIDKFDSTNKELKSALDIANQSGSIGLKELKEISKGKQLAVGHHIIHSSNLK